MTTGWSKDRWTLWLKDNEIPLGAYSYIIYKEEDIVKAKNGQTGAIEFQDIDASTVIQNAIDALTPKGGKIIIKRGEYTISNTIFIGDGVTIEGESMGDADRPLIGTVLIAEENLDTPIFENQDNENYNITIKNLSLNGNKPDKTTRIDTANGVRFINCKRCRLENLAIFYFKGAGVYLKGGVENNIINSSIRANNTYGIFMLTEEDFHIIGGEIGTNQYSGVVASSSGAGTIMGCHIFLNQVGIDLYGANRVRVVGVRVNTSNRSGIRIYATSERLGHNNIITGCHIYNNGKYHSGEAGIKIEGLAPSKYNIITNNIIIDYQTSPTQDYGIYEINGDYNMILNNTTYGNKIANIYKTGTNTIVKSNIFYLTEKSDTAIFSGDGTTTQFKVEHGLVRAPSTVIVTPMSADAKDFSYVEADDTYIYFNFSTAPPSGTDNVKLSWYAEI